MDKLTNLLKNAEKIAIFSHINPDGDAIGSSLAINSILQNMNKTSQVFLTNKNESFAFLPGFENIKTEFDYNNYDLIIVNDCPTIDRLDYFYTDNPKYFANKNFLVFDHHISSSKGFGHKNKLILQNDTYSSTCGLIFDLLYKDFSQYFDKNVATNLFFGVYTDTGGFIHEENSKRTFAIAKELLELGADKKSIINKFVKAKSFEETKFLGELINRTTYIGNIIYTYYDIDELEKKGINKTPKLGYNILSKIDGPKALIIAKKDGDKIKCGMRSKGKYNVQQVADYFGGGGHKYAAGFSIKLEEGIDYKLQVKNIIKQIDNLL